MKSFLQGRAQVSGGLNGVQRSSPGILHSLEGHDDRIPDVEVVKQGDKVVRIVVTCACGERIEIECLYPPAPG